MQFPSERVFFGLVHPQLPQLMVLASPYLARLLKYRAEFLLHFQEPFRRFGLEMKYSEGIS